MSAATEQRDDLQPVNAKNVDLSNCDREQIHIPGAIQPHGALLVLQQSRLTVIQASANCEAVLGIKACLTGRSLEDVFGPAKALDIQHRLAREPLDNGPCHILRANFAASNCDLFAHRSGDLLILEVEVISPARSSQVIDLYSELKGTIARLQVTKTLQAFFDLAVSQIRHFTGFERVMAYKFLEDGSGHVIAESKVDALEPYLGLHYPASDIPAPARRMFALSWLRHLPDVNYQSVQLDPELHPVTGEPVDLSRSLLRSVSVMYVAYLQNMGAKATMVMPLVKEGELWGLIACQHQSAPRHVAYEARMAAEFLAHMLSLMMASKEDAESLADRLRAKAVLDGMMQLLAEEPDLHAAFGGGEKFSGMATYIDSAGVALVTEGQTTCLGRTPPESDLRALARWLTTSTDLVVATDRLAEVYPPAGTLASVAAGVLAVRLSKQRPEFIMWFRPEQAETVSWAGNPSKPVVIDQLDGAARLRPRGSFAVWQQSVVGRSRPWAPFEVTAAADLRWAIVEVILARAEETQRLNRELHDANLELDSFAYVASHDLKEPLRGITHMANFLERGQNDKLDDQGRGQIATIVKLTKRMDDLIESLLHYSRIGRTDLPIRECDLNTALDEALMALQPRIEESGTLIRRPRPLPKVMGDPVRLREVFTNLISNAVKFTDKTERWVEVGWREGNVPSFYVRDNGIGIAQRDQEAIFQIFRRLHGRDEFGGGTGAGLTIARKTVERHGGRMWVDTAQDEGTSFWFTLRAPDTV